MRCGGLQIRGAEPSEGSAANPGKIGEGIANNINGPDAKGAASEVCTCCCCLCCCDLSLCTCCCWLCCCKTAGCAVARRHCAHIHLSTCSRLLRWLSCNSLALLCHHACPKIDIKCSLLQVVAHLCLIFSLLLQCDNLSTKGAPRILLVGMEAVATEPVVWCGVHQ